MNRCATRSLRQVLAPEPCLICGLCLAGLMWGSLALAERPSRPGAVAAVPDSVDDDSGDDAAAESVDDEVPAAEEPSSPAADPADARDDAQEETEVEDADSNPREKTPARPEPVEPADPAEAPAKANPLGGWLQRVLEPKARRPVPARAKRVEREKNPQQSARRDPTDRRAPYDTQVARRLAEARIELKQDDWKQTLEFLQGIFERSDEFVIRLKGGQWSSVRSEARAVLGQAPAAVLENYRGQYAGLSRQLLNDALSRNDRATVAEVASKYLYTDAGMEAANLLGSEHFDRGEFGLALRCFNELLGMGAAVTREPAWRLKCAYAARMVGDHELAESLAQLGAGISGVTLAGKPAEPQQWLSQHASSRPATAEILNDWPLFYGNPAHTGVSAGGDPLLLRRWTQPLTQSAPVQTQLAYLLEDLRDQESESLPTFFPLMVDGKIIFRTLQGVHVVDAETGRALWETPDELSAEALLTARGDEDYSPTAQQVFVAFGRNGFIPRYYGGAAEHHQLSHLLFRNANYGIVSSDGRNLYVVEDQPILSNRLPGQYWPDDSSDSDSYGRNWSSNKLVAYDLKNGRPRWEVGGAELNDPFELPLAGQFFLGAPVVDGDDLFVIGEKDSEIRLFVLNPKGGELRWSKLLAYSQQKIENDVGRQWWNCQVAVAAGVVICPTTAGWMQAIDRKTREILWPYRYVEPKANQEGMRNPGEDLVQLTSFNEQWASAPPIIAGDRVLYTPAEEPILVCLSLHEGRRLWQMPRGNLMYVAGAFNDRVLLVGPDSLSSYSLDKGRKQWSISLDHGGKKARPAGRGVFVGKSYHLPLVSGELWTVDTESGRVTGTSFLPPDVATESGGLGNLAMYRGMLISLTPLGLTTFEQREAIETAIHDRLQQDPHETWANLRQAELRAVNRDYKATLAALREIRPEGIAAELRSRYRQLLMQTLTLVVRSDPADFEAEFAELGRLCEAPEDRLNFRRLQGERLAGQGRHREAFDIYLTLIDDAGETLFKPQSNGPLEIRPDAWLAGQLRDLWRKLPESEQTDLDGQIAKLAEQALHEELPELRRAQELLGFHAAFVPVTWKLIETCAATGQFLEAEHLLAALREQPATELRALVRTVELLQKSGLTHDTAHFARRLESNFADASLGDKTVAALLADWRVAGHLADAPGASAAWTRGDLAATKTGANYNSNSRQELPLFGGGLPYFASRRLEILPEDQRLVVIDAAREQIEWSQPLRNRNHGGDDNFTPAMISEHQVVLLHHGVLHCLSPVERRVVWTYPIEERLAPGYGSQAHRQPLSQMTPVNQALLLDQMAQSISARGALCVANRDFVCYLGRRKLVVLDARTGKVRWTRGGVQQGSLIEGHADLIYVVAPDRSQALALRSVDGAELPAPKLMDRLQSALCLSGRCLVTMDNSGRGGILGLPQRKPTLECYDPVIDKVLWMLDVPVATQFAALSGERGALLLPSGQLQLLDLHTGKARAFGAIRREELRARSDVYALTDYTTLYLLVNRRREGSFYSEAMSSVQAHGTVHAFDLATGTQRWEQPVKNQNLILEKLDHSPLLIFAARRLERRGDSGYWALDLVALDKQSGRKLIESRSVSQMNFQSLQVNIPEQYVELRAYNERIRLSPKAETAAAP